MIEQLTTMHDSGRTRAKHRPSFVQRLRRNTLIVVLFSAGAFVVLPLLRQQSRIQEQAASNNDRQDASEAENRDGLGSSSYEFSTRAIVDRPSPPSGKSETENKGSGPAPKEETSKTESGHDNTNTAPAPQSTVKENERQKPSPPAPLPGTGKGRKRPPAEVAQEEAARLMNDIYKTAEAKTPEQKAALAGQLFNVVKSQKVKPEERFTLLRKAADLAADGGDLTLALNAIRQTAGEFEFDGLAAQQKTLARIAPRPMDAARAKIVLRRRKGCRRRCGRRGTRRSGPGTGRPGPAGLATQGGR